MQSKIKALLNDDRGVSPVIGVILMVAITVILAAVIGTFVLGLGDSLQQAPQSTINADDADATSPVADGETADVFNINHNGGDELTSGDYRIQVTEPGGNTSDLYNETSTAGTVQVGSNGTAEIVNDPGAFGVGDQITVEIGATGSSVSFNGEWSVQIIHVPSDTVVLDSDLNVQ